MYKRLSLLAQVMGKGDELRAAVATLAANASFNVDARVHVFELTIRAVGGLLSAHMLIQQARRAGRLLGACDVGLLGIGLLSV